MTNLKLFICASALFASLNPAFAKDCADGSISCGAEYLVREESSYQLRDQNDKFFTDKQKSALDASTQKRLALIKAAKADGVQAAIDAESVGVRQQIEEKEKAIKAIEEKALPMREKSAAAKKNFHEADKLMDQKLKLYRKGKLTAEEMKPFVAARQAALAEASKVDPELEALLSQKRALNREIIDLTKEFEAAEQIVLRRLNQIDFDRSAMVGAMKPGDAGFDSVKKAAKRLGFEERIVAKALRSLGLVGAATGVGLVAATASQADGLDPSVIEAKSTPTKRTAPALLSLPAAETSMSVSPVE